MPTKKYKYNIVEISPAGETVINSFVRLKDAKEYVELFPNIQHFIVPRHEVNYYIEYYGRVFTRWNRKIQ
jgi:hypothetical protein